MPSSGWWKRYVRYEMYDNALRLAWKGEVAGWKERRLKVFHFDEHPPWTTPFKEKNRLDLTHKEILVEPISENSIFKGDRVQVLSGKDKGKQGIVSALVRPRNWVYVEGLNAHYEMQRRAPGLPPTCMKIERPLIMNRDVQLVDPTDFKPTKVEWRFDEKGDRVRVSVRSSRIIPLPIGAFEVDGNINPKTYAENANLDTTERDILQVTFVPKIKTFEQDVLGEMGIVETKKKAHTFWY